MDLESYVKQDATDMAQLIRSKEVSAEELLTCGFKQLEKVNPKLNAVVHDRKDKALLEVKKKAYHDGPFSGIPMLLKDISQSLKGERITSGSRLLKDAVAPNTSNLVRKLQTAGFIFMGHTNAPEFGLKNISEPIIHGPARNPWNTDYSPGGSSGGSAAAVAAGVVPIAGASDGGGSIRIPASFTSLFGLKPTRGRTPVGPGSGRQWHGAAVDFVLSRTVRDSAAMLDLLQVVQPEAAFQTPLFPGKYTEAAQAPFEKPLKIAFTTRSPVGTPVSQAAIDAVEKVVKWLEDAGHDVEEQENDIDGIQLMRNYFLMNSGEMSALVQSLEEMLGRTITADDVEIETWILNQVGKNVTAAEFTSSLASWDVAAAQMAAFHETYDFYITPSTAYTAPKVGELTHSKVEQEKLRTQLTEIQSSEYQDFVYDMFLPSLTYSPFTQLANLTGQPAVSLPIHLSEQGLPMGVQVTGPKGAEHRLLQLATQVEQSDIWIGMKGNPFI